MDAVGDAQLRQGPADADHGNRPWSCTGTISGREGRVGVVDSPPRHVGAENNLSDDQEMRANQRDRCADTFERLRKLAQCDEVEMLTGGGTYSLTRFANNTIHQNVSDTSQLVSVRAIFNDSKGRKTARASTNKTDD